MPGKLRGRQAREEEQSLSVEKEGQGIEPRPGSENSRRKRAHFQQMGQRGDSTGKEGEGGLVGSKGERPIKKGDQCFGH